MTLFFTVLSLLGPLAVFLYGFHLLSNGLLSWLGPRLKKRLVNSRGLGWLDFLWSAGGTAATLSQSANTVFLVSLADTEAVPRRKVPWILLGVGLGGSAAAWLAALAGNQMGLSFLALLFLVLSLPFQLSQTLGRLARSEIFTGTGFFLLGLELLNGGLPLVTQDPYWLDAFRDMSRGPFGLPLLFAAGAGMSALFRSSIGVIALAMALGYQGWLTVEGGAAMVLGSNLGFSLTGVLAGSRLGREGRRAATMLVLVEAIACMTGILLFPLLLLAVSFEFPGFGIHPDYHPVKMALFHSFVHLLNPLVVWPLMPLLEKAAEKLSARFRHTPTDGDLETLPSILPDALESNLVLLDSAVRRTHDRLFELLMILMNVSQEDDDPSDLSVRASEILHIIGRVSPQWERALVEATALAQTKGQAIRLETMRRVRSALIDTAEAVQTGIEALLRAHKKKRKFHSNARQDLYEVLTRALDLVRYNADWYSGGIAEGSNDTAANLEATLAKVHDEVRKRSRKLLEKSNSADRRAELAFLEVLAHIDRAVRDCRSVSDALRDRDGKG